MRARLEEAWGAKVTEAMGIGDIGVSLWGECEEQCGMHLGARGFVHAELVDPESGAPIARRTAQRANWCSRILRHQAAPLLRFRTRDHVEIWTSVCRCGRTAPRVRCIGRTDDMLIVRGVNVFPSAIREVVNEFAPAVSGVILVQPSSSRRQAGAAACRSPWNSPRLLMATALAEKIQKRIRDVLVVSARIDLVPWGTFERSEYKSKLVQH